MRSASATAALAVCLVLSPALFAQAQNRAHAATPAPAAPKAQAKLSDTQLESAIRTKFAKSKSATTFSVRVQGGVAHIGGKTDVVQHKAAATRMARSAGAVAVDNKVQVSEAAKARASGNLAEGRRRAQVTRSEPRDARR